MTFFTFIPVWVAEDLVILILGLLALVFIIEHEERPRTIILELVAFCFLYAAVYENFATMMGWYAYGRSILMVFNVPFSVPLAEYLVLYSCLRFLSRTKMPDWAKPFVVGLAGMIFDFSLDPVAIRQVFQTQEGRIGRWTWYPALGDAQIFGEPVYNFTGWILICGFAAGTFLAGRSWYARSGYKPAVGLVYPFLAALVALGVLVSPLSRFLLWLAPFGNKGSSFEWWMLGIDGALGLGLLLFFLGRRRGALLPFRKDWPAWLVLCGLPLLNLVTCVVSGYREILGLVVLATAASLVTTALMASVYKEAAKSSGSL